jgi:Kef-type K+ transport system membrane component KefB
MHYLDESHILIFLLQVLVLLGLAKTLSMLCEAVNIPAITGEILAGVFLGPTLFGWLAPDAQQWLFPNDQVQWTMLDTVSWLGVFFSLL